MTETRSNNRESNAVNINTGSQIFEQIFGIKYKDLKIPLKEYLEIERMIELSDTIFKLARQTIGKNLSVNKKNNVIVSIRTECLEVSTIVRKIVSSFDITISQEARLDFWNKFESLRKRLIESAKKNVFQEIIDENEINDIQFEYLHLMESECLLETILVQELKDESGNKTDTKPQGKGGGEKTDNKGRKLKEPSKKDCKIYLYMTTTGNNQTETAKIFFPKLKPKTGQSYISRAIMRMKKWLEACGLPTEQALGRIKEIAVDPTKIDLGERTDGKRHGDPVTNRLKDEDDQYDD